MGRMPEDRVLLDLLEEGYSQRAIAEMYGVTPQAVSYRKVRLVGSQRRELGATSRRVFEAIVAYKRAHDGNSPTIRGLSECVGRAYSVIYHHLQALERGGLIRLEGGTARQICVVGGRWEWDEDSAG